MMHSFKIDQALKFYVSKYKRVEFYVKFIKAISFAILASVLLLFHSTRLKILNVLINQVSTLSMFLLSGELDFDN